MTLSTHLLLLAASFCTLFLGYAMGRRIGRREGILEGIAYAPLDLRRRSWERGACIICGTLAGSMDETLPASAGSSDSQLESQ